MGSRVETSGEEGSRRRRAEASTMAPPTLAKRWPSEGLGRSRVGVGGGVGRGADAPWREELEGMRDRGLLASYAASRQTECRLPSSSSSSRKRGQPLPESSEEGAGGGSRRGSGCRCSRVTAPRLSAPASVSHALEGCVGPLGM